MKLPKPCKECSGKRYGSSSWCRSHFFARERAKRDDRKARALTRKLGTKTFQKSLFRKLKIKLDKNLSLLIRSRGLCERCGKRDNLQASHIYGRANMAVRWSDENLQCLCAGCHRFFWHEHPQEAQDWLRTVRTPEQLEALRLASLEKATWTVEKMAIRLAEIQAKLSAVNS